MTGQFKDFKSEIVASLEGGFIPFVQHAATAEPLF